MTTNRGGKLAYTHINGQDLTGYADESGVIIRFGGVPACGLENSNCLTHLFYAPCLGRIVSSITRL